MIQITTKAPIRFNTEQTNSAEGALSNGFIVDESIVKRRVKKVIPLDKLRAQAEKKEDDSGVLHYDILSGADKVRRDYAEDSSFEGEKAKSPNAIKTIITVSAITIALYYFVKKVV